MGQDRFNLFARGSPQGHNLEAYERILAKRTVIQDDQGRFWFIPVPNDQQLPIAVQFLAQHIGAEVQTGQHPITGDFHALCFSTVGCRKNALVFELIHSMMRAGCYFADGKGQYARQPIDLAGNIFGEPRILPEGHDCVYAPRPPHPFAHLGPILWTKEPSGVAIHFGLDLLESKEIEQREAVLDAAAARGAYLYDRTIINPITGDYRTNLALGYPHNDPALAAIWDLKTCFSQNAGGRWLNHRGEELGHKLVAKIGSQIRVYDRSDLTHTRVVVALPLSRLTGVEQAYLDRFIHSQAPLWGVGPEGIKTGTHRETGQLVMGISGRGEGAKGLLHFFAAAHDNSSLPFATARVDTDPSSSPFAGLIPGA